MGNATIHPERDGTTNTTAMLITRVYTLSTLLGKSNIQWQKQWPCTELHRHQERYRVNRFAEGKWSITTEFALENRCTYSEILCYADETAYDIV